MQINSYLQFDGTCEEAMNFYKSVLGGEFSNFMRFEDAPPGVMEIDDSVKQQIMHCSLQWENAILMASDTLDPNLKQGSNYHVSLYVLPGDADRVFNGLSEGGIVSMPLDEAFWGGRFGMFTDRFGIQWMLSCDHKPE